MAQTKKLIQNPDLARFIGDMNLGTPPAEATKATQVPPPPAPMAVPEPPAPLDVETLAESTVKGEKPGSPHDEYLKNLEKIGVTRDEAAAIVDAMLFKNVYEEDVQLTKKLSVRFRTRGQDAIERLNKAIDTTNPVFNGTLYSLIAEYNIAASLVQYGPYKFTPETEAGFEQTHKFIKALPSPIFGLLANKLAKFDTKLTTIMQDGVVEDFF